MHERRGFKEILPTLGLRILLDLDALSGLVVLVLQHDEALLLNVRVDQTGADMLPLLLELRDAELQLLGMGLPLGIALHQQRTGVGVDAVGVAREILADLRRPSLGGAERTTGLPQLALQVLKLPRDDGVPLTDLLGQSGRGLAGLGLSRAQGVGVGARRAGEHDHGHCGRDREGEKLLHGVLLARCVTHILPFRER